MKKLMFGLAALAAGSVMAIESANVVGFQTYPLVQGYNLYAPTFDGVSKGLNIQDVKVEGSEGWATDFIYIIDENGLLTEQYYSWNCPDNGYDTWCWVDELTGEPANVEITSGTGFYLYADADDMSMMVSGQVKIGEYKKDLVCGYNITGNFCPVDLSLQSLKLEGSEGWATDFIYVIDENGLLTEQYYSWNCPDNGFDDWCWVDELTGEPANATVKAGEGIYLYADVEGMTLKLPAVITK